MIISFICFSFSIVIVMLAIQMSRTNAIGVILREEAQERRLYYKKLYALDSQMFALMTKESTGNLSLEETALNRRLQKEVTQQRLSMMEQYTVYLDNIDKRLKSPYLGIFVF